MTFRDFETAFARLPVIPLPESRMRFPDIIRQRWAG